MHTLLGECFNPSTAALEVLGRHRSLFYIIVVLQRNAACKSFLFLCTTKQIALLLKSTLYSLPIIRLNNSLPGVAACTTTDGETHQCSTLPEHRPFTRRS